MLKRKEKRTFCKSTQIALPRKPLLRKTRRVLCVEKKTQQLKCEVTWLPENVVMAIGMTVVDTVRQVTADLW